MLKIMDILMVAGFLAIGIMSASRQDFGIAAVQIGLAGLYFREVARNNN